MSWPCRDPELDELRLSGMKKYLAKGFTPQETLKEIARSLLNMGMSKEDVVVELNEYGRVAEKHQAELIKKSAVTVVREKSN